MSDETPDRVFESVIFRHPEAYRLADMHGVLIDLQSVRDVCTLIVEKTSSDERHHNSVELEALQWAAMVRYGRCFVGGGKRTAYVLTRERIDWLGANRLAIHDKVLALRNKHIAHSINDWEINSVTVQLEGDPSTGTYS